MTIWAFNKPDKEDKISFVYNSLKQGKSRFGWSYLDSADLRILEEKEYEKCSSEELKIWDNTKFLLDIEKGDWIVHINIPKWGLCSAVKVIAPYEFDYVKNNLGKEYTDVGDFRHMISIAPESLIVFDRDDSKIHPELNKRLKLQGKQWRIKCQNEFFEAISQFKKVDFKPDINGQNKKENTTGLIIDTEHIVEWNSFLERGIKQDWLSQKKFKEKYKNAKIVGQNGSFRITQCSCNKFLIKVKFPGQTDLDSFDITSSILKYEDIDFIDKSRGESYSKKFKNCELEFGFKKDGISKGILKNSFLSLLGKS